MDTEGNYKYVHVYNKEDFKNKFLMGKDNRDSKESDEKTKESSENDYYKSLNVNIDLEYTQKYMIGKDCYFIFIFSFSFNVKDDPIKSYFMVNKKYEEMTHCFEDAKPQP